MQYSVEYVRIICLGIPFSMLIIGLNTFINTQGRTFIGMVSVIIGAFINIVLDAVFVLALDMGVAGAAWATVIGQTISAVWVVGFLSSGHSAIRIRKENLIPDIRVLKSITSLGISSSITTGAESLVNIILNYSLKKYGALALTGYTVDGATLAMSAATIITSTSSFIRLPINGFSQGLQPVISYNYGAGRADRVKQAIRFAIIITTAYAGLLWIILMVTPGTFTQMFTNNTDVVTVSESLIRVYIFGMILSGIQSTMVQAFSARGMRKHSLIISLLCKGLYVPLLLLFPFLVPAKYSLAAIYAAQPVTDVIATLISFRLYKRTETQYAV